MKLLLTYHYFVGKTIFTRKGIALMILMLTLLQPQYSQDTLDLKEWIGIRKENMEKQISGGLENSFQPSWVRELEFRTETEDFLLEKQEYLLRFRPSSPSVRQAQSRLVDASLQERSAQHRQYLRIEEVRGDDIGLRQT